VVSFGWGFFYYDNDGPAGSGPRNHFVNFRLVGTRRNRDARGVRIKLRAGGISQIREIEGGGNYRSQSDLRANFGLGTSRIAEEVEVRWPSGLRQLFRNVAADRFYMIVEGHDRLQTQAFSPSPGGRQSLRLAGQMP